jgi:dipicolinate synthase subunit A
MGANLYVASKMFDENAYCRAYGIKNIRLQDLNKYIGTMNVIINTIPALFLNENILNSVSKKSLIIDIASKPGGVDFEKARNLGIKTIWALSLPGKIAPETSAKIVKNTLLNIMHEMEG